jgi:uncharacterized protein (UPF0303 family)
MSHAVPEYTLEQLESTDRVDLPRFTNEDAFELGTLATEVIAEWGVSLAVDILIDGYLAYRARLGTTGVGNDPWLLGKAAVVEHYGVSSLLVRLRQEATGVPFTDLPHDHEVMRAHGGSIPIYVDDALTATITMSGEPDVIDHEAATEALRRYIERHPTP